MLHSEKKKGYESIKRLTKPKNTVKNPFFWEEGLGRERRTRNSSISLTIL
jgi:hypothetical protein